MTSLRKRKLAIHGQLRVRLRDVTHEDFVWDRTAPVGREFGSPDFDRLMEEDFQVRTSVVDPASLELQCLAEITFGSFEAASEWLHRRHPMLEGETPNDWAKSACGAERVKEILVALRCGGLT